MYQCFSQVLAFGGFDPLLKVMKINTRQNVSTTRYTSSLYQSLPTSATSSIDPLIGIYVKETSRETIFINRERIRQLWCLSLEGHSMSNQHKKMSTVSDFDETWYVRCI